MILTEARTILAEVLWEERPIPVHPLAAESVGVPILPQLGHSVSVTSRSVRTEKCMYVGLAYEVLFTYIELLAILVQLEFLFFRHLNQAIRGISETFQEEVKTMVHV